MVLLSLPVAISANFNAEISRLICIYLSPAICITAWAYLVKKSFYDGRAPKFLFSVSDFISIIILITAALIINELDKLVYVSDNGMRNYNYEAHIGYLAAVPFEILKADYPSRLRIHNLYPLEWTSYHFLSGSILAQFLVPFGKYNIFHFTAAKFVFSFLCLGAMFEAVVSNLLQQQGGARKYSKAVAFSLLLLAIISTWYYRQIFWSLHINSGLSVVAAFLFFYFRLSGNMQNSYVWMAILSFAAVRNAPAMAIAMPVIFAFDYKQIIIRFLRDTKSNIIARLKASGFEFQQILPAIILLFWGGLYVLATLRFGLTDGYAQANGLNFDKDWWKLSSFNVQSETPLYVLCLILLFSLVNKSRQLILNYWQFIFILLFLSLEISKFSAYFHYDIYNLIRVAVLPLVIFIIGTPTSSRLALFVIFAAHFLMVLLLPSGISVPAFVVIESCYLALLFIILQNKIEKLQFSQVVTIILLLPLLVVSWKDYGYLGQEEIHSAKRKYHYLFDVEAGERNLDAAVLKDGVYCGTNNFQKDDAFSTFFAIRRGWDPEMNDSESGKYKKVLMTYRHSILRLKDDAHLDPETIEEIQYLNSQASKFCN